MESILCFISQNDISPAALDETIRKTQDLNVLNALLDIKISSDHQKINFNFDFIYENDHENFDLMCLVLPKALLVSEDVQKFLLGIAAYININHSDPNFKFKIVYLLNAVIQFCSVHNALDDFFLVLSPKFITTFLLQALIPKETKIMAYKTLCSFFLSITNTTQIQCINDIFRFCHQQNNLDILCGIFNNFPSDILDTRDSCFSSDMFWIYLESCITSTEAHLQKQGEYILFKCVNVLKYSNKHEYLTVSKDTEKSWEAFFILLDIGKEKQLHLIEPALDLIKYVDNLNFMWKKCIYRIFLRHSESIIVYKIAIHILNQVYKGDYLQTILEKLLPAINRNEYSEVSCQMFNTFKQFCSTLCREDFEIVLKEIVLVSWNPISFWKIIQSVFVLENKMQIKIEYFSEIIRCAANIPHMYIRSECIHYLVTYFWDKKSFFKMNKIVNALLRNNINFSHYCHQLEYSLEIADFVINELLNFNDDDDLERAKIYLLFLENLKYDIMLSTISKNPNKLSSHIKLLIVNFYYDSFKNQAEEKTLFYKEMETFLREYFSKDLNKSTADIFIQFFSKLMQDAKYSLEHLPKQLLYVASNSLRYNYNQIYVALTFLSLDWFDDFCNTNDYTNVCQTVIESWRHHISKDISVSKNVRICQAYIKLIFKVNDGFSLHNTKLALEVFELMFQCQSNEALQDIFEKVHRLLECTEHPELVIDLINKCHKNLLTIKRDQHFIQIVNAFIRLVCSPIYMVLNWSNSAPIKNTLLELSEGRPIIRLILIKYLNTLITDDSHYQIFLVPTVDIYLQGTITTKEARTEFVICQRFLSEESSKLPCSLQDLNEFSNPNLLNAAAKFLSLEVLLKLAKNYVDLVTNYLREKYLKYFKKRYFPDSEIHLKKLRIMQAIMLLIPYVQLSKKTTRQVTIFVYDCFLEEANQNCIKQLFNCILILMLLNVGGFAVIEYIRRITTSPTPASATALVGLLPSVYHLTVLGNEETFHETMSLALPWTMGAQFKLRVYAQELLRKLFNHARQRNYDDFLQKYEYLEACINSTVESSGAPFRDTMKSDLLFLNDFDLMTDNSYKTIFCDIPRLNNVSPTEWKGMHYIISRSEYLAGKELLFEKTPLNSQSTIFSDAIDTYLYKDDNMDQSETKDLLPSLNIQKKITPWKTELENFNSAKVPSNFILIASLIDKPQNLGGLSRTCEVFGIKTLVLSDAKIIKNKEFRSLSMSSENWIKAVEVMEEDLESYISVCQKEGYCVVGAEQTACSEKLNEFKFPHKTALLLGNEKTGIPPSLIPLLNACLEIPQFGQIRSLNVHVAGATFIWEYAKQHLL